MGDYLDPYLSDTKKVNRYSDPRYPKGMVSDRLCDHIVRLRKMASHLPLTNKDIKNIDRIILVHDLPETVLGDITAILKKEKQLDTGDELSVAKDILNSKDFALYTQFTQAENFLYGTDTLAPSHNAAIAKILDSLEGSMYFHTAVAKWIVDGNTTLPPQVALRYFYDVVLEYRNKIQDKKLKELASTLIDQASNYIELLWAKNEQKMPKIMKQDIERYHLSTGTL